LAALVLFGPGVLLQALLARHRRAVELPLFAAAFWVVAFWWLRLLPWSWTVPVAVLGAVSLFAGAFLWRRLPDAGSALVWAAAATATAILARSALVAPGVDAAAHTAVARILGESHGHPLGFRPLWPLDELRGYPFGQPTLTALLAGFAGLDWRAAGCWGHALDYGLVLVAFAAAVGRWRGTALGLAVGAGAVLVARAPLHFWTWGGAPNALGIAFGVAAFAAGLDAARTMDARSAGASAIYAAAGLLTHAVTVVALAYCAVVLVAAALVSRRMPLRGAAALVAAGGVAAVLCAPYLATVKPIDPRGAAWIRAWLRESATLSVFPRMLHDVPLIAGAAALVAVFARSKGRAALPAALAALLGLLVLHGRFAVLPGSALLYPDRIAVLLLYPIALLAHDALDSRPRVAAGVALLLLLHAGVLQRKLLRDGRAHALATEADLRLLSTARLPEGCWVMNNYGDAGQWIPALLGRPITFPHIHVAFFGLSQRVHPCAAFRGEKRPYHVDTVSCPGPGCEPIARDGGAELFRIVDPALSVELSEQR
jgi:hypothetical protein